LIYTNTDKGAAILVNQEEWSGLQETLYLRSIPGPADSRQPRKTPDSVLLPLTKCSFTLV